MREIKFRVWSVRGKLIRSWEYVRDFRIGRLNDHDDYIPMQFTGLLDKNGKEIWEGDVLEYYSSVVAKGANPIIQQVVEWKEWHYEGIRNWKQSEVIGNIYENPELLERQK